MTLKQCYEKMNGDYEGVSSRLCSDELIQKFMLKFMDDTTFQQLCSAVTTGNQEDMFRAAHTLKGVCSNLGFQPLYYSSSALAEHLRNGMPTENFQTLFAQVKKDYQQTILAISAFQSEIG